MSDNKRGFDPMLNIPSMEELDRQWRESQTAQNTGSTSRTRTQSGNSKRPSRSGAARQQGRQAGRPNNRQAAPEKPKITSDGSAAAKRPDKQATKKKKEKKPKKFKKFRLFLKIFLLILLMGVLGTLVFFYFKYGDSLLKWKSEAKQLIRESTKDTFRASESRSLQSIVWLQQRIGIFMSTPALISSQRQKRQHYI